MARIIATLAGAAIDGRAPAIRAEPAAVQRRSRCLLVALVALTLVLGSPAAAQRGRGGGGGGGGVGGGGGWSGGPRGGQRLPADEMPTVEGFSLSFNQILEIIDRGQGREALSVFERTASTAAQSGDRLLGSRGQSGPALLASCLA